MVKNLKIFLMAVFLLPLLALPQAGQWAMDFDEDFAAASSAWTPAKLGDKLAVWFDAADNATVLNADGNPASDAEAVQQWSDKSGNARNAVAASAEQRPSYRTAVQNGRAVLRTDGESYLVVTDSLTLFRNKTSAHIFIVAKDADQSGGSTTHLFASQYTPSGSLIHGIYGRSTAGAVWATRGSRVNQILVNAVTDAATGHNLIVGWADWGNGYLRCALNGAAYVSTAYNDGAGVSLDIDFDRLFSLFREVSDNTSCPANSEIAEVVVVNAAMTEAEITALQSYLKNKWGTP
jgi:hypothetical protein